MECFQLKFNQTQRGYFSLGKLKAEADLNLESLTLHYNDTQANRAMKIIISRNDINVIYDTV